MSTSSFQNIGHDLLRIHKVLSRALAVALQSIQDNKQAEVFPKGFLTYVRSLTIVLHSHHDGEDSISFPFWRRRFPEGPFDRLSEQHGQMLVPLGKVENLLQTVEAGREEQAFAEMLQPLAELKGQWRTHIELEEAATGPESTAKYLSAEDNGHLGRQLAEHGQAHAKPGEIALPFVVYNLAGADRAEYLKLLPPTLSQELIPNAWKPAWAPMKPFLLEE